MKKIIGSTRLKTTSEEKGKSPLVRKGKKGSSFASRPKKRKETDRQLSLQLSNGANTFDKKVKANKRQS